MTDFVQYSDPLGQDILYAPSQAVADPAAQAIQTLIQEMKTKMTGVGIGLAANQVGHHLQLFMIEFDPDPTGDAHTKRYDVDMEPVPYQVFINPKITAASEERVSFWHGCLSAVARDLGQVATYRWIEYEALNEKGEAISGRMQGMGAVIFQHEFRHLLGSLYIDHAKDFLDHEALQQKLTCGELEAYTTAAPDVPHLLSDYQIGESIEAYSARIEEA